jgi:hypothetical protein
VAMSKQTQSRTGFPIAAGILTIISACTCIVTGIIGLILFAMSSISQFLAQGVIAVFAFAFGLASGIMSLKRRYFAMARIGMYIMIVAGLINVAVFGVPLGYSYSIAVAPTLMGLLFGLPILILSVLSIIFVSHSMKEFSG